MPNYLSPLLGGPASDWQCSEWCTRQGRGLPRPAGGSGTPPRPCWWLFSTGSEACEGQADIVIQCTDLPHRSSILQFVCPLDLHAKNNNVFSSNANCDGALLHGFRHVLHFEEVATGREDRDAVPVVYAGRKAWPGPGKAHAQCKRSPRFMTLLCLRRMPAHPQCHQKLSLKMHKSREKIPWPWYSKC